MIISQIFRKAYKTAPLLMAYFLKNIVCCRQKELISQDKKALPHRPPPPQHISQNGISACFDNSYLGSWITKNGWIIGHTIKHDGNDNQR